MSSNAKLLPLGGGPIHQFGGSGISTYAVDLATDQMEWIVQAPEAAVITRLGYLPITITGAQPTYRISIQGVTGATGFPDGVVKGGGSPASATFVPSGAGVWAWVTLDNPYTVARGEFFSIVIDYSSGVIGASNFTAFGYTFTNGATSGFPYSIFNAAGVRTKVSTQPIYGFAGATRVFGVPFSGTSCAGPSSVSSDTTPDETGLRFIVNSCNWMYYSVAGIRASVVSGLAAKTIKFILYDGTTPIQDVTYDTDHNFVASAARAAVYHFDEATLAVLRAGKEYRVTAQPQDTAVGFNWHVMKVAAAADLDAYPGRQNWFYTERTNAGAWTDTTTIRPVISLILRRVSKYPPALGIIS